MSKKTKQHYVPRLYLKQFASQPKRINVHIIQTNEFKQDISLRDQCQQSRFYGKTNDVEDDLMKLESTVGPAVNRIVQQSTLPVDGSTECAHLLLFAAFQVSRTRMAAGNMMEGFNKMLDLVKPKDTSINAGLDERRMDFDFALRESLRNAGLIAECWTDLGTHLILNVGDHPFFTSDNPVVLYNQYCEGIEGFGTTGATKRGLQVFLPLSPRHLALFYDKHVYKVGERNSNVSEVLKPQDLNSINLLQAINADKVLLFSNWRDVEQIRKVVSRSKRHRKIWTPQAEEFPSLEDPENESLLKIYQAPVNVDLDLSFLSLRRKVQSIPKRRRAIEYRDQNRMMEFEEFKKRGFTKNAQRFVRKDLVYEKRKTNDSRDL
jgi:hypothetical protein